MDCKREGFPRLGYSLVEDDSSLLGGLSFHSIVPGDKLSLLRNLPSESRPEPVAQLLQRDINCSDTVNTNDTDIANFAQHRGIFGGVLAQQTMQRSDNLMRCSIINNNSNTNEHNGATTTTTPSSLATIGTNTYNCCAGISNNRADRAGDNTKNGMEDGAGRKKTNLYIDGIIVGHNDNCGIDDSSAMKTEDDERELINHLLMSNQHHHHHQLRFHASPPSHHQHHTLFLNSAHNTPNNNNYHNFHRAAAPTDFGTTTITGNQQLQLQQFHHNQQLRSLSATTANPTNKKSGKKNTRKERGTTINVQELEGYIGYKAVEDIMLEFQPRPLNTSGTVSKKEKAAIAVSDPTTADLDTKKEKTKRFSSPTRRSAGSQKQKIKRNQQRRDQHLFAAATTLPAVTNSRGTSAEDVEVPIELDMGNDVSELKQPNQNDAPAAVATNTASAYNDEVDVSMRADHRQQNAHSEKKPLLERIPSHILRQLREKASWQCPFTICNPFLNDGTSSNAGEDRDSVLAGPVEPWLERSAGFPLPAQLLQHFSPSVPLSTSTTECAKKVMVMPF